MTQPSSTARLSSKSDVPSAGMRGGLGRTLLTAFLLLSIVPLSLISYVASTQAQHNLQRELEEKLDTIATLTESQINNWVANQQLVLSLLASNLSYPSGQCKEWTQSRTLPVPPAASIVSPLSNNSIPSLGPTAETQPEPTSDDPSRDYLTSFIQDRIIGIQASNPSFTALLLVDQQGHILAAHSDASEDYLFPSQDQQPLLDNEGTLVSTFAPILGEEKYPALVLTQPVAESDLNLVALLDSQNFIETVSTPTLSDNNGQIYLVPPSGPMLKFWSDAADTGSDESANDQITELNSVAAEAALAGQSGAGSYVNHQGMKVIGAYRWLSELNMALLVEQPQDSVLASSDSLAVVLIGVALAVALLTALIAAAVTRRITLPIVQLTATAVQIAAGDLNQKVPTTRRDEIGILARAFNVMTSKLRVLYEDLEQQVRERTHQLRRASAEANYRAMQLAISAEIARVITSILDHELLIPRVIDLIRDCFQAYYVSFFVVDENKEWAILREGSGWLGQQLKAEGYRVDLTQDNPFSRATNNLRPYVYLGPSIDHGIDYDTFPHTQAALAVPLKVGQRPIGILDVHSAHKDAFAGDEIVVLETLAGQIAVAIENARIYEMEHKAVKQLRELEESRRRFLSNMSRELRMPLNNIIGFSRVMLKGIDGPITDLQQEDLNAIHESGQQLLALINDILDIAQIEAGAMELSMRPIDLGEIARSVIPTTNALLQGRPITLKHEITSDLPPIMGDPFRLRQVLVKLLSNAVKFTHEGEITLRVWPNDHQIVVSVSDTGIGIPDEYRKKVFEMFQQLPSSGTGTRPKGTGLGLTFSKEIIEMHGGIIEMESKENKGTTFTIALPIIESANNN